MERTLIKDTPNFLGKKVKVAGWINSRRDHGKLIFVDIRDSSGILQVVLEGKEIYEAAKDIREEWVVEIEGEIKARPRGKENTEVATSGVEMGAEKINILSKAKLLPFEINDKKDEVSEEIRMKHRYLDLRRNKMKENLVYRHKIIHFIRNFLTKENFIEVETPILGKSTPEGARDFIIPSRLNHGSFYALPQSPQQYKQLLMVAGLEKYFQIVKCFRDEDSRADRQLEFTQLDIEMSFTSQEEIIILIERLYTEIIKEILPEKKITKTPFLRMTYKEAMKKYNTDRPDLREDKNNPNELAFVFITDFPMFEWHENDKKWGAMHHPFTMPQERDIERIKESPADILAFQYDFVLNGYEIGGGSMRTTDFEILKTIFEILGHDEKEVKEKFKNYFEAFSYGVPPHSGIASGLDRFLAIILNESSIREVIAFPKTGDGRDLLMGAPSFVDEKQLKELGIEIVKKNKK